jgi:hypothetical protein
MRSRLVLYFLLVIPVVSAVACALVVLVTGRRFEEAFLSYWLNLTPLFIAGILGPVFGRRLADAVGYHWSYLATRSLEFACALAAFAILAIAASMIQPMGWVFPVVWGGAFLIFAGFDFIRALMAR